MQEQNITKCKICQSLKLRILSGKFNARNKRWKDEYGLDWNGRTCGSCNQERVKNNMRKFRSKE
jgi:hypothetical protein